VNFGFRWRRLLIGAFIFVETAAFRKLGGFSQEAFAGEELELSWRLKKLAKETGKRFVILHRHPVITSARRRQDLSVPRLIRGVCGLLYHIIFKPHHFTANREAARAWYDGQR